MDELGVSEDVFQNHLAHGNSVLLANLIHITRHLFDSLREGHQDLARESLCILHWVSKFNILNTLPELQHEFCNLWNLIVQQAQNGGADDIPFIEILIQIRHLYIPCIAPILPRQAYPHSPLTMTTFCMNQTRILYAILQTICLPRLLPCPKQPSAQQAVPVKPLQPLRPRPPFLNRHWHLTILLSLRLVYRTMIPHRQSQRHYILPLRDQKVKAFLLLHPQPAPL